MKLKRLALTLPAALLFLFGICGDPPTVPDTPRGPSQGMVGVPLACTTQTTDPSGGQVAYQFDWGDGTQSTWSALMDGGTPYADTHSYSDPGSFDIKARAKNSKKASAWSEPLSITINPGEGQVRWKFAFTDPEDPEDSADFSLNTFCLDIAGDAAYIGCEYGALLGRRLDKRRRWEFLNPNYDEFIAAPTTGDDGTVYIGCTNDTFYAINPDGTRKWTIGLGDEILATAALASGGTIYVQTGGDSLLAINPADGSRLWSFYTAGGNSSPVVGPNGTVYVATQDGMVYALDPGSGTKKYEYYLGGQSIEASPAIDVNLSRIYVADEDGHLASLELTDLSEVWTVTIGEEPSSPVIDADGTIYIGAGGKLLAVNPQSGSKTWEFPPPLLGVVSSPAVSSAGRIYVLVTTGKKDFEEPDSLYGVKSDGTRLWAAALGEGYSAEFFSSPKLDDDGNIYIGSGLVAWCIRGQGGPAQSSWPMFQGDARNTGRAKEKGSRGQGVKGSTPPTLEP